MTIFSQPLTLNYCTQSKHTMKFITSLIFILSISPAYAEIYKCMQNGHISYQQTQCSEKGAKFILQQDISIEQQEAAANRLATDLKAIAEKKKIQQEERNKERLLRAQEDNVNANYANARANREQAQKIAEQTEVIKRNRPYYSPYRYRARPLPSQSTPNPLP